MYNTSPGRGIENVGFKGQSHITARSQSVVIAGYDDARVSHTWGVSRSGSTGGGDSGRHAESRVVKKLATMARLCVGAHVEGLVSARARLATKTMTDAVTDWKVLRREA